MADIRDMLANMNNDKSPETAPPPAKTAAAKKVTIEKMYQKKTQLEHILLRPDTYIGSVEQTEEMMWVYDLETSSMVQKKVTYVPGLYKIFDEILVNAADHKQKDPKMDCIKIEISQENNVISVWNNGQGIPVTIHGDEKIYVPTMIFGHLLTSSNYNDEEQKVTGGRNGYGAKLCNIFSTKFTVETASKEYKRQFKQSWGSNMTKASEAKIKDFSGSEYTKITFSPDLAKFKMDKLDDDIVGVMSRRAFDIAASTRGVKVFLNGKRVPVKNFRSYIDLFLKSNEDGETPKVIYETVNDRWEVGVTLSNTHTFQQISFVNSVATTKGGRHVDYVTDMVCKQMIEVIKKKNKGGINITPAFVKSHMWIFVNCLIVNPTYSSQTKEHMTLQMKNFGSKCTLSPKFFTAVAKGGIVEAVLEFIRSKENKQLLKISGKKSKKVNIDKLDEANKAGSEEAYKCTLILTEGDSAKSSAVSGLGVVGRDYYGVFPLRGKLLNVRDATSKQFAENPEIQKLVQMLGLVHGKKYNTEADVKRLRYGKVMIMTDQDQDGSHIKGLLINFIHSKWPELLRHNFLEEFITPIVKATKRKEVLSFYSIPEFEEWKGATPNHNTYNIKYYKGLGTSSSSEMKEYFSNMNRHRIKFRYSGQQDDDHIILAFSKKHVDHRKEWLTNFMVESKRRKEIGLPEKYLYTKDTRVVSFTDFVNLELVLFSNADNVRSIPCLVDGVKPGQRKVLFTCFKRKDRREVKVAQLAGFVAAMSAYHHGEVSLCTTIVNLAQNFVGSNNINLLEPKGQFGTRLCGGKDSASPRYIFTKLSPLARLIFHPDDDPLLKYEYDDNKKIEPVCYVPIIPMVLVNGAEGIGTGWMTKIPNYNPREIVQNLRNILDGEEPVPMLPWYKNFLGTVEDCGDHRYVTSGEVSIIGPNKIEITELPISTWTQNYKENVLEPLSRSTEKSKAIIANYNEYNTDTTVKFVVTFVQGELENLERQGLHKVLKLQSLIHTTSMCVFDDLGCLRRFDSVMDMLNEFCVIRRKMYKKRKDYLEGLLEAESARLSNQARFIKEKCSGEFVVENKKRKTIIDELIKRQYAPDPVQEWRKRIQLEDDEEEDEEAAASADDSTEASGDSLEKDFKQLSDVKKYDYLLGMTMWMLTDERKNELIRQSKVKLDELEAMRRLTPEDLWRKDLNAFSEKLTEVEEKEKAEEMDSIKKETKKGGGGKKKMSILETMPSGNGRRILPTVGDDLKKRIQNAVKIKENKNKRGVKKEILTEDDKDEFDMMVDSKKTLKDKIGTPEEAEKKAKGKKQKDGFKQTKLNFKTKSEAKVNGSPKKRGRKKQFSDSEDDISKSGSDVEFSGAVATVKERTTSRRVAKTIKYSLDSSEEEDNDTELELTENNISKDEDYQAPMEASSESENEVVHRKSENSDDLFDSLIGIRSKSPPQEPAEKKYVASSSDSEKESPPKNADVLRQKNDLKKRTASSSGSEKEFIISPSDSDSKKPSKPQKKKAKVADSTDKPPKKRPTKPKPKKKANVSDDDSDAGAKKKKTKKKKKIDTSDESDFEGNNGSGASDDEVVFKPATKAPAPRSGRAVKQIKYNFDSDESD